MNLLVVLVALGLRQFAGAAEPAAMMSSIMRRWRDGWLGRAANEGWNPAVALAFVVLPPALLVLVLMLGLAGLGHGLWSSLLSLGVMLVVLLDRQRPEVKVREQAAWARADEEHRDLLAEADRLAVQQAANEDFARARLALLAEQLRELFSPLFWFLLLGPVAAVAYYFLRLAAERESPLAGRAGQLLRYADWPVARVLALSFALAGDFLATWQHWRAHVLDKEVEATEFLEASATAAQAVTLVGVDEPQPGAVLGQALEAVSALLHRALIIWVVLLALHTLWP